MKFYQEKVEVNPKIPARIYRGPDKVGGCENDENPRTVRRCFCQDD